MSKKKYVNVLSEPDLQKSGITSIVNSEMSFMRACSGLEPSPDFQDFLLGALNIQDLKFRKLNTLSGGEAAKLNIAALLYASYDNLDFSQSLDQIDISSRPKVIDFIESLGRTQSRKFIVSLDRTNLPSEIVTYDSHKGKSEYNEARRAIEISGLNFRFSKTAPYLFNSLELEIFENSINFLTWGNGAGKSVLFKILSGVTYGKNVYGKINIFGRNIKINKSLDAVRKGLVAYAPQNSRASFYANSIMGMYELRTGDASPQVTYHRKMLQILGIDLFSDSHPLDISNAEARLNSVAQALISIAPVILLDEPTVDLSPKQSDRLFEAFQFAQEHGKTIICASHDAEFIARFRGECRIVKKETKEDYDVFLNHGSRVSKGTDISYWKNSVSEFYKAWAEIYPEFNFNAENNRQYWKDNIIPNLSKALVSILDNKSKVTWLDLGCGSAWNIEPLFTKLEQSGIEIVNYLGIDAQSSAIEVARECWRSDSRKSFQSDDIKKFAKEGYIDTELDIISMFFVLHDDPQIDLLVKKFTSLMTENTIGIISVVTDEYANKVVKAQLAKDYHDRYDDKLSDILKYKSTDYPPEFGCLFPIINSQGDEFYVPYLHRSNSTYIKVLNDFGFEILETISSEPNKYNVCETTYYMVKKCLISEKNV